MPSETYTGRLSNDGPQVSIENGPILAIEGPDPCAAAARQYARFGETQPVTVRGTRGKVDSIVVLYVTSIGWAAPAVTAKPLIETVVPAVETPAASKSAKKDVKKKSAGKRS